MHIMAINVNENGTLKNLASGLDKLFFGTVFAGGGNVTSGMDINVNLTNQTITTYLIQFKSYNNSDTNFKYCTTWDTIVPPRSDLSNWNIPPADTGAIFTFYSCTSTTFKGRFYHTLNGATTGIRIFGIGSYN